jgi:hypothetical protein
MKGRKKTIRPNSKSYSALPGSSKMLFIPFWDLYQVIWDFDGSEILFVDN